MNREGSVGSTREGAEATNEEEGRRKKWRKKACSFVVCISFKNIVDNHIVLPLLLPPSLPPLSFFLSFILSSSPSLSPSHILRSITRLPFASTT